MTEQEQKELELFKKWWKSYHEFPTEHGFAIAEEAWFARAKLDRQTPSKTLGSYARSL